MQQDAFYQTPVTYISLVQKMSAICGGSDRLRLIPIGKSCLGRKIFAMGMGDVKNATLMVGGVHGQEWLTALLLVRFGEDIANAYARQRKLLDMDICKSLDEKGVWIVPCLNPDGVEIAVSGAKTAGTFGKFITRISQEFPGGWSANVRGIDINRNFDAGFEQAVRLWEADGITSPRPKGFGGRLPESEPETKAIVNFIKAFDIKKLLAFHSQGEELYYSYGEDTPACSPFIAQMLAASCGYTL